MTNYSLYKDHLTLGLLLLSIVRLINFEDSPTVPVLK